jgi:hypothetical protein
MFNIPIFEMKLNENISSLQTIQELTHKNISNIVQITTGIVTAGSRYTRCVFQLFPASSVTTVKPCLIEGKTSRGGLG